MSHQSLHSIVRLGAALLVFVLASPGAMTEGRETIYLRDGSLIQGEILKRRADDIVVDLGFTVVTIPAEEIEKIVAAEEEQPAEGPAVTGGDLFRVAPRQPEQTVRENVDRCGEAVVQVRTSIGLGSGFIIHSEGYVVTNHHVIAGEHKITVTMFEQGDRELRRVQFDDVRIVAINPHSDLALLKIEGADGRELPTVPLGDSSRLGQGQTVFSIGSPLGLDRSVSQGIVSLKNRPLGGHIFIQSTTPINPGNSGGPLFNLRGEVIGINNMKVTAEGIEGLGFGIPSNILIEFLKNRDAFAFDARSPNAGFRYNEPPVSPTARESTE